jgi:hypothetical protein
VGAALLEDGRADFVEKGRLLAGEQLDDRLRLQLLANLLATAPLVLVLDDFEQDLAPGGGAFRDPAVAGYLNLLLQNARQGRLLLTCRHPLPGLEDALYHRSIGPLSQAGSRKLLRRLEALGQRDPAELDRVLRLIGGHPRMLEFLDGLLRGGQARLPAVTRKLRETMAAAGLSPDETVAELGEGIQGAVLLGARDVFLEELMAIARAGGDQEALLQLSVSNLPVSPAGLAHMLADGPLPDESSHALQSVVRRLEALSLVYRFPGGEAWVHRWTAEGLAAHTTGETQLERHNRAGRYRWWRVENESHSLEDGLEAIRNHLAGRDFDTATDIALGTIEFLRRVNQSAGIAALAGEVLETLPVEHPNYGSLADEEGRAYMALGFTGLAFRRYESLAQLYEKRVELEPDRSDHRRNLSVVYNTLH